ncbi:glycosyltransferase family 4 protein [Endothiovibrio diazotrophicus]
MVQLLPALDGGGVERGTLEVARALVERGHRSIVISGGGRMVPRLEEEGSRHLAWPIGRKLPPPVGLIAPLRRLLREERVDVLHARSRMPAWIALAAWRGMAGEARRPRFVTTVHGFNTPGWYSSVMVRGERVIAVSAAVRDFIFEHYPWLERERVVVIHRGVDPGDFPYGYRPADDWLQRWYGQYPQLRGATVVTLPGRITRLKGHLEFIRLLAALRDRGVAVKGLVVGGEHRRHAGYLAELREQVAVLGVEVLFTGHRDDMREIYAVSDLVLSLSTKPESFGRTVLEALSLGTPVVGYDHGGVGEVLGSCFPAGRVPLGEFARLVERVEALLARPPEVPPVERFTLARMLDETLRVYGEAVGDRVDDAADGQR